MAMPFDRQTLEAAFHEIGRHARADGRIVDIAVYGGTALVLTLDHRQPTRDVDPVGCAPSLAQLPRTPAGTRLGSTTV